MPIAARLDRAIRAAGIPITGISPLPNGQWRVFPPEWQAAAQPIIDAFDPNDPAHDSAELNLAVSGHLAQERIFSAIVWAILDTYSAPATVTKYNAAKTKIVAAFKNRPWLG